MASTAPPLPARPLNHAKRPAARWTVRTAVGPFDESLAAELGISPVTAAILRDRGHATPEAMRGFLEPDARLLNDPALLPDIGLAVERLHRAICGREKLLVYGDYDVDGITSTALLVRSLRALGADLDYRIPERHEGYGLSVAAVEWAAAHSFRLILTADCGITATVPARRARELAVDLIITDHHDVPAELPDALAVVNPKRRDSRYGYQELSGCGVAFKVVQALLRAHWPKHEASFEERFVDLVALAAIADCVSLTGENRYLASRGLRRIAQSRKFGLQSLMAAASVKPRNGTLHGQDVAFRLAPRLNAAGRLGSPLLALELLLSQDSSACQDMAQVLEELNHRRQRETQHSADEAINQILGTANLERDCLLVAAHARWEPGVVGLIASRLVERFHRPAFALQVQGGVAHGSGRSIDGFHLGELLDEVRPHLISGGGHAAACGLSLHEKNLDYFRAAAGEFAATRLSAQEMVPRVKADCAVRGLHLTQQLVTDLNRLEPCGVGNEAAALQLSGAHLMESRPIGRTGEHFRWRILADGKSIEALWWRSTDRQAEFAAGAPVDLVFVPELNTFNGATNLQLIIKDARPAG